MRKLHIFSVALASFAAFGLLASTASAQSSFGKAGSIAISSDLAFSVQYTSEKPPAGDSTNTMTFTLGPALDYFLSDGLSLGGQLLFQYVKPKDGSAMDIGISPRVGYAIPIGDKMAFWPKLGIVFDFGSASPGGGGDSVSQKKLAVQIFAPFVIQPAEHFFIGVGPDFSYDVYSNVSAGGASADGSKTMVVGVMTQVGGWF